MNLKFPVNKFRHTSVLRRWASRIVAEALIHEYSSYHCVGKPNYTTDAEKGPLLVDIQVPSSQMARWVLQTAGGYEVNPTDVVDRVANTK